MRAAPVRLRHGVIAGVRRLRACRRGVSMLEMALVLPFLLTLAFGVIDTSVLIQNHHTAHTSALYVANVVSRQSAITGPNLGRASNLGARVIHQNIPQSPAFRIVTAGVTRTGATFTVLWIAVRTQRREIAAPEGDQDPPGGNQNPRGITIHTPNAATPCATSPSNPTEARFSFTVFGTGDDSAPPAQALHLSTFIRQQAQQDQIPDNVVASLVCIESRPLILSALLPRSFPNVVRSKLLYVPGRAGNVDTDQ